MKPEDYPPQEPLSDFAKPYHAQLIARAAQIEGVEASYGEDPYQRLAVYPAPGPRADVLVFLHGGGWTSGYKEWMAFMAPGLNAAGVTLISAGYRLAPAHVFPCGFEDCAAAIAWVYRHIAGHGGNRDRLFVGGHSAGGHYASLLAVRRDWQGPRKLPSAVIRGCLPVSGVYDFTDNSGLSMRPRFLGPAGNEIPASPMLNIHGAPPPFFMAWGEKDFPHLIRQAAEMEQALLKAGGEVERLVLPGCDHLQASLATGEPDGPWLHRALAWLRAID
jgi:acetyl esterase/lipase